MRSLSLSHLGAVSFWYLCPRELGSPGFVPLLPPRGCLRV